MQVPIPELRPPLRDEAKLLTAAALYLLPLSLAVRTDIAGPNIAFVAGVAAITISQAIHLREAVIVARIYPPRLLATDLSICAVLLAMLYALSRPTGISFDSWTFAGYARQTQPLDPEQSIRTSWLVFWTGGCLLFVLIPVWSTILRGMGLMRRNLRRYVLGWITGETLCLYLLIETLHNPFPEVFAVYSRTAFAGVLPFLFLFAEVFQDTLYDTPQPASSARVGPTHPLRRFLPNLTWLKAMSLPKGGLVLAALTFAGIGLSFLIMPLESALRVDIALPTAMARTDLRAAYGGFNLGFGAFLAICALRTHWIRPGLAAVALAATGFAGGRLLGIVAEGTATALMLSLTVLELAAAGVALFLLRRSPRVSNDK